MVKNTTLFILVIALVISFIFLFLTPIKGYVPYNKPQPYSTYEPMFVKPDKKNSQDEANITLESNAMDDANVSDDHKENFEPVMDVPKTVHYGPFRDSVVIDKFSQITTNGMDGVDGCVSSGLTNSGGYICLTPELIKLLKTRGGNAAGGECLSKCA